MPLPLKFVWPALNSSLSPPWPNRSAARFQFHISVSQQWASTRIHFFHWGGSASTCSFLPVGPRTFSSSFLGLTEFSWFPGLSSSDRTSNCRFRHSKSALSSLGCRLAFPLWPQAPKSLAKASASLASPHRVQSGYSRVAGLHPASAWRAYSSPHLGTCCPQASTRSLVAAPWPRQDSLSTASQAAS